MSWVVEQSEDSSAVNVSGDTVTCRKDGYYGSPINILYNDPADKNGDYFWQFEYKAIDSSDSGHPSIGLTTQTGFQSGWGLKAMKYLGNLSDGSALLVSSFGESIKDNDKVGILLQLTNQEMKMFIFHNDRPLGLAFHIQSPYPKPLFPVVSFNSSGKIKVSRSQQMPKSLNRGGLQFSGVEGDWKIVNYPQHPECVGCTFKIKAVDQNTYRLNARVVNTLNCTLTHNPTNNRWTASPLMSTMMGGPPAAMEKESVVSRLISNVKNLQVQNNQHLVLETNDGEQVQFERFEVAAPSPVTQNVFQ